MGIVEHLYPRLRVATTSTKYGKTDVRYWSGRLFKTWRTRNGERSEDQDYSVKIQYSGRRENFGLKTSNKAIAAGKSRDIYVYLVANGWEPTIAKYKQGPSEEPKTSTTVGEFLDELKSKAELRPKTLEGYAVAFREIVGDIFEIDFKTDREHWRKKVHAIRLDAVTPARVQEWKRAFLARAENPVEQRTAKISVNTFIRRAKGVVRARCY
jgi:hypothetical protein